MGSNYCISDLMNKYNCKSKHRHYSEELICLEHQASQFHVVNLNPQQMYSSL